MTYSEKLTYAMNVSALALALNAVFIIPASAEEQWPRSCNSPQAGKQCQYAFQQGLAPVQLGAAKDGQGLWGYMDTSGRMAIAPAFTAASGFVNGMAAAAQDGQFGYIDQKGDWLIAPRFTRATPFNADGTALVETDNRLALINKQGEIVKTFPFSASLGSDGFVNGQALASVQVQIAPSLWNAALARSLALPEDIMALSEPQDGLVPAQKRDARDKGYWGYLDENGEWAVDPMKLKTRTLPQLNGNAVAVQGKSGWVFVDRQGATLNKQEFKALTPLSGGNWLVTTKEGKRQLLNAALEKQSDLPDGLDNFRQWGTWLIANNADTVVMIGPDNLVNTVKAEKPQITLLADTLWISQGAKANNANTADLLQIYDMNGVGLLTDATLAALKSYQVAPLNGHLATASDDAAQRLPLAVLTPQDATKPPAILTSHGEIFSDPQWASIDSKTASAPLLVRTENSQVGAVDANGQWVIQPQFQSITPFDGDYGWATQTDEQGENRRIIDRKGVVMEVPTRTLQLSQSISDGLLLTAEDGENGKRWGLWDIQAKREIAAPTFDQIEPFQDGFALAKMQDQWGVINRNGGWAVRPDESRLQPLQYMGNGMFLAMTEGAANSPVRTVYSLLSAATGQSVVEGLLDKPRSVGADHWLVQPVEGGVALIDSAGRHVMEKPIAMDKVAITGDWVMLNFGQRYGALNSQGEWQVAPIYTEALNFVGSGPWASAVNDKSQTLIDRTGQPPLPDFMAALPMNGLDRLADNDNQTGESVLRDLSGEEIRRFAGLNSIVTSSASEGLVPFRGENQRYGFIDASGKKVIGAYFDQLGPMKDSRARAVKSATYGPATGYIDQTGRYVISPRFEWASDFSDRRAWVVNKGQLQLIDTDGGVQAQILLRCNQRVVVDAKGQPLWPAKAVTCAGGSQ
ncbi:WG repeat-containing protein [Edaphovirga cremea]|uniref:WG repeat-containing protein n=1 Tax=Edaphovirga cremea TaxID=2267246 RepID=UPI000DEF2230|nr:WG repeat-containing protein [Edaphovirga cremea]